MECKEDRGEGRLELSVKNLCADYATQEQLADIKNLVEKKFVTKCLTEPVEAKSDQHLRGKYIYILFILSQVLLCLGVPS